MENTKKNILFINHSVRDGGPGRSLFYILKYLDRNNVKPYVLIPKDDIFSDNLKNEGIYENIILDGRFPENIFVPRMGMDIYNNKSDKLDFTTKLKKFFAAIINIYELILLIFTSGKIIKENNIDVVYCNGTQAKVVGTFIGKFNKKPVIWHVRNIQQKYVLKTIITKLASYNSVKRIIPVSNATAMQFNHVKEKVHVVYNGIDPSDYSPAKTRGTLRSDYKISRNTVIIGSTGRLVPRKGYIHLIEAARYLKEHSKNKDFVFVIVGDTPHFFQYNHLDYLKKKVSEYGLDKHFIFTGYKSDIMPYLKNFDIFVIPSNYPDPFPRSVIEAMCFKLPVIGFRIGGIAEAIDNKVTGYLSDQDDVTNLSENILSLVNSPDERKEMGIAARERVIKMCNAKDISKSIEKIILSVN